MNIRIRPQTHSHIRTQTHTHTNIHTSILKRTNFMQTLNTHTQTLLIYAHSYTLIRTHKCTYSFTYYLLNTHATHTTHSLNTQYTHKHRHWLSNFTLCKFLLCHGNIVNVTYASVNYTLKLFIKI